MNILIAIGMFIIGFACGCTFWFLICRPKSYFFSVHFGQPNGLKEWLAGENQRVTDSINKEITEFFKEKK
jgi:hypothetical protein